MTHSWEVGQKVFMIGHARVAGRTTVPPIYTIQRITKQTVVLSNDLIFNLDGRERVSGSFRSHIEPWTEERQREYEEMVELTKSTYAIENRMRFLGESRLMFRGDLAIVREVEQLSRDLLLRLLDLNVVDIPDHQKHMLRPTISDKQKEPTDV